MHRKQLQYLRRFVACLLPAIVFCYFPASLNAFDTYWHSAAARDVGKYYGFSPDATKTLQLSSFAVDYYWIFIANVESTVEKIANFFQFRDTKITADEVMASRYLHFDNLNLELDRNWKFDYIWSRLLQNTKSTILSYYHNPDYNENDRKELILLTLGASLHTVEDFYCHTDWIHYNFTNLGFPILRTENGLDRAPTWFEVRKKFGAPSSRDSTENWKFQLFSGIYPPKDDVPKSALGVPLSHTSMNHDNSQLFIAGQSQIKWHRFGPHPAFDTASAREHVDYATRTAIVAAKEWIGLLEQDISVNTAIEFAKNWDLSKTDSDVRDDLEDGLHSARTASCIFNRWDGSNPPPERKEDCEAGKTLTHIHIPKQSNKFWGAYPKYNILQNLTKGIGDKKSHYTFDANWTAPE